MDYCSNMRLAGLTCLIILFHQQVAQATAVVTVPPNDAVKTVGDHAKFYCKIDADPKKEAVQWTRTLTSGTTESIYKTFDPDPLDNTKYNFTKLADLETEIVVKQLKSEDAGDYKCAPMTDTTKGASAQLVIIEKPLPAILDKLVAGKQTPFNCDIYYAGKDLKNKELQPELFAKIGTMNLPTDDVQLSDPTNGDKRYRLRLDYNMTVDESQHGQNFTCGARVHRSNPTPIDFEIFENILLEIHSPTTEVKTVDPVKEMYYPGENISCTANGFPVPKLNWVPVMSGGAAYAGQDAMLLITEQMLGDNQWKCQATRPGEKVVESEIIRFKVLTPTEPPAGETKGDNTTTIAVAVVVPIVVLLVVGIVICVVCKKRKSGAAPKTKKSGDGENKIYNPVSTKAEPQVSFQEETATFKAKESDDPSGKPKTSPRRGASGKVPEEHA